MLKKKPPNRLSHKQAFICINWLQSQKNMLGEKRLTLPETAELMTRQLGFPVNAVNLEGLCKSLEISWPRKKAARGSSESGTASAMLARYLRVLYLAVCGFEPHGLNQVIARHRVTELFTEEEKALLTKGIPTGEIHNLIHWKLESDE